MRVQKGEYRWCSCHAVPPCPNVVTSPTFPVVSLGSDGMCLLMLRCCGSGHGCRNGAFVSEGVGG
jgi:hypothetical protein